MRQAQPTTCHKQTNNLAQHIISSFVERENSIFVLDDKADPNGWHDFPNKDSAVAFAAELAENGIDFLVNPNW